MPYKREGALKVSEHWVRSPLLEVNRSCVTCHPYGDEELRSRVEAIQDRHFALLTRAGQAATQMLDAIVAVRKAFDEAHRDQTDAARLASWQEAMAKDPALRELGELQRAAQWRLDFVAAENSMGFHAPQELARILGESIDLSRQAEVKAVVLAGGKLPPPVPPQPLPAVGQPAEK
jgi:nitrite reductase (cytochrome c-552)